MLTALIIAAGGAALPPASATPVLAGRQIERLDRGLIAVPATDGGNHVSWRLLGTDPATTSFTLYRDGRAIAQVRGSDATSFVDKSGSAQSRYTLAVNGRAVAGSARVWANGYLPIKLDKPADRQSPDGKTYSYSANDASAADLDGDGRYEIVVKWYPSIAKDNAFGGWSGNTLLDAYTLDGKRLWRIDLGKNIRSGAHYTQFQVFDYDGDGRAEMIVKTADGTIDGVGKVIGDANADWMEKGGEVEGRDRTGLREVNGRRFADVTGRIMKGPEYLTVFDGRTGRAIDTVRYSPSRHPMTDNPTGPQLEAIWGDSYANRSDRYLAGTAYLDGKHPSAIFARGYYGRTMLAAWDYKGGKLTQRWLFDSTLPGLQKFSGQGNHNLSVADVDGDGKDEIIYGSMVVDDNGTGLWSDGLGHGDALHVSDLDPSRPGLERFGPHENMRMSGNRGASMVDAKTGELLWSTPATGDTGRGVALDIDPRHPGSEAWASNSRDLYDVKGNVIPGGHPSITNFGIYWDGDRLRELLDGKRIMKWDWTTSKQVPMFDPAGTASNNGSKQNPALSADLLGDWREELVVRTEDSSELRVYSTPFDTKERVVTLMHDPVYRLGVAWQNTAYNQPPHLSYYFGEK